MTKQSHFFNNIASESQKNKYEVCEGYYEQN